MSALAFLWNWAGLFIWALVAGALARCAWQADERDWKVYLCIAVWPLAIMIMILFNEIELRVGRIRRRFGKSK